MRAQPFIGNPWHGGEGSRHYIPQNLAEAAEILVRGDRLQSSLAPKFAGPLRVVSRRNKHFTVRKDGRDDIISTGGELGHGQKCLVTIASNVYMCIVTV